MKTLSMLFAMLAFTTVSTNASRTSPAISAHAPANMAALGIASRDTATMSGFRYRELDPVRVAAKLLKKSAPSVADQNGKNAPPAVPLKPSPVGPIIIPVGPDPGPAAPPRPSKPPRPPNTCIGQVCPLPIPLPN